MTATEAAATGGRAAPGPAAVALSRAPAPGARAALGQTQLEAQRRAASYSCSAPRGAARQGGGVGGGPSRAQTRWVIWSVELRGLGVQARVGSGSLCSASASFWEKSCAWRRGWCVTQREAGGAGR